jgi:hypothetical protein
MTLALSGTNGLLQAYDYQTSTTGFSYTFAAGTQVLVMNPAGTLATGTITMPASPSDGMTITFSSSQQISALTLNGNTGQSVVSAVTFLPAKTGVSYVYRSANTSWYPTVTVPGTGSQLVSGTAVATTSGTSVTFSSIPSWVKRITVMFNNVTISGSTVPAWSIRIGPSGGVESTGYVGFSLSGGTTLTSTTGFIFRGTGGSAATDGVFSLNLQNATTNTWCAFGVQQSGASTNQYGAGTKSLAGTLTQLALVTNGTDTFTAGSVNILYE